MSTIFVIGLGPGDLSGLPLGTYQKLHSGLPLYFRTAIHPAAQQLREEGLKFNTFDSLYEQGESFEFIYREMADILWERARQHGNLVYAVPGHPLMAEQSVQNLLQRADKDSSVAVEIGSGQSFFDVVCQTLSVDPIEGLLLLDATRFQAWQLRPDKHTLVAQVFSRDVASDVKLTLMEVYPDDYEVTVVCAAGVPELQSVNTVPLYELDRVSGVNHLTTLYVPPTQNEKILCGEPWYVAKLVSRLRAPDGCPWDKEQTHQTLRKYMLEEAYEVVHAIDSENPEDLAGELGDVLLQVLLHGEIAGEVGDFTLREVFRKLGEKLLRRHPHVFAGVRAYSPEEAESHWQKAKAAEKREEKSSSVLSGVKDGMPSWMIASEIQKRAAKVGFDWPSVEEVFKKVEEELGEFRAELNARDANLLKNELGDLLFVIVNVARWLDLDIEEALSWANQKFVRRFGHVEKRVEECGGWKKHTLSDMDEYWKEAKELEQS